MSLTITLAGNHNVLVMALASSGGEPSEADLVTSFRSTGDNRHFEGLYRAFRRKVFGVCYHLLRSADAAEDATHEAFLRAYEQFSTLRGTNFSAWVVRIASNLCLNRIRQDATRERAVESSDAVADGETAVILAEETGIAREVLRSLGPEQRKVLLLRYLEGYSHQEIETITGYDAAQVRSYLQNGRRNFRIRWLERIAPQGKEAHGFGRT